MGGLWYNMSAEIRIAQGCFVSGQRNTLQTDSFALVGRQPCIISRGRESCRLVSATVGSVDSAGLFALRRIAMPFKLHDDFDTLEFLKDPRSVGKRGVLHLRY